MILKEHAPMIDDREEASKILHAALLWARGHQAPMVLASTTGRTARELLDLVGDHPFRLTVVTHDRRRLSPREQFDPETIRRLRTRGFIFLEDRAPCLPPLGITRWLEDHFKISQWRAREQILKKTFGIGGMVCFLIVERAAKAGWVREHETAVAVAGSRCGVDTAFALEVQSLCPVRIRFVEKIMGPQGLEPVPGQ